jgi:hypothetical protein
MLPVSIPYHFVAEAEIKADDARLALIYPGHWQRCPESMDYLSVSAVGFNPSKTKAMLYQQVRNGGDLYLLELRSGSWVSAPSKRHGCSWSA